MLRVLEIEDVVNQAEPGLKGLGGSITFESLSGSPNYQLCWFVYILWYEACMCLISHLQHSALQLFGLVVRDSV